MTSGLSLTLYLNSLEHRRNIFGSSSEVFGNLRKLSENVRERSSDIRNNFGKSSEGGRKSSENQKHCHQHVYRELTNRRLLHDAAVRLRDMLTAHTFLSTCQRLAKGDDVGESDLPASWKQEDVRLVFKVFSQSFGYFYQII